MLLTILSSVSLLRTFEQKCLDYSHGSVASSDFMTLGTEACKCDFPCTRYQYDTILSSSLLGSYKIRDEIKSHEKSRDLLPRYQEAVEISAQVKMFPFYLESFGIVQIKNAKYS